MDPDQITGIIAGVISVAVMLRFYKYFFGEGPVVRKGSRRSRGKTARKNFF
jgi:hypothetical protein